MKYSYNWLKELSGTKKSPEELAQMVGLKGFELEGVENLSERFEGFVVGEILEIKKHPNADKLQLVKVEIGQKSPIWIVCGAWNIKVGDKVPVALPGAVLPQNKLKIEKREVRGQISNGMLCAEDELGMGKDHGGIKILDPQLKVGQSLAKALGLSDTVVDFDILPNRAHDCLSHEGMAREIAAMENKKIKNQKSKIKIEEINVKSEILEIDIRDEKGCPRYFGAVLESVKVGPSPDWMQARLVASGMEPINNVVDITNYVMLEIGNPLHAFDMKKIKSQNANLKMTNQNVKIIIRKADRGERLELLDGTVLELDKSDLVIANDERALALAGIKGGKKSGVLAETKNIVLEAANFDGFGIRKSRQRHCLLTESQARFEKGISPVLAQRAVARAIELLEKIAGAKLVSIVDADKSKKIKQKIKLGFGSVEKLLGYAVPIKEIVSILENLGFLVEKNKAGFLVEVPFWRLDIEGEADLIEEIGRVKGYEKVPEQAINVPLELPHTNKQRTFEWNLRDCLVGLGLDEVSNYSFYDKADADICGEMEDHFEVENPLSKELSFMRLSLLPGILKNISLNKKHFDTFSIFELGRIYQFLPEGEISEKVALSGAFFSKAEKSDKLFYCSKSKIENLIGKFVSGEAVFESSGIQKSKTGAFHPSRCAAIFCSGKRIGFFGQANKDLSKQYSSKGNVVLFEIDVEALLKVSEEKKKYVPLRKFPSVSRDISMFVPLDAEAVKIADKIKKDGGEALKEVRFFDQYIDKNGKKKSLACRLEFWDEKRTLEGSEVDRAIEKIVSALERMGAEVRKNEK